MDLMGKFSISASMLLTGFVIVFAVLFLLIFIIWLYGTIVSSVQNKAVKLKAEKEKKNREELLNAEKPESKPAAPSLKSSGAKETGASDEIAAVISAAVYSMYGSTAKVKIKSIKRHKTQSAWARASLLENNQPF